MPALNTSSKAVAVQLFIGVRESVARFFERDGKTYLTWPTESLTTRLCQSVDELQKAMTGALEGEKEPVALMCLRVTFYRYLRPAGDVEVEVHEQHRWHYDPLRKQVTPSPL